MSYVCYYKASSQHKNKGFAATRSDLANILSWCFVWLTWIIELVSLGSQYHGCPCIDLRQIQLFSLIICLTVAEAHVLSPSHPYFPGMDVCCLCVPRRTQPRGLLSDDTASPGPDTPLPLLIMPLHIDSSMQFESLKCYAWRRIVALVQNLPFIPEWFNCVLLAQLWEMTYSWVTKITFINSSWSNHPIYSSSGPHL